jgi:NADH-quinone oxidoreductase subunit L
MAALADVKIIDRFIHFFAITQVVLAHIVAWLDKVLVDGLITLLTSITSKLGAFSRSFQTGKVHGYFIFALMATIILLIWIIIQ